MEFCHSPGFVSFQEHFRVRVLAFRESEVEDDLALKSASVNNIITSIM